MDRCRYIQSEAASGAMNMALDEVLLEAAAELGGRGSRRAEATLRVYQWARPTLSLGYFQAAAERESLLRQLSANSDWRGWLARHLDIVFDSLLADPIYGGNIEQAGWRWLAHQPGFPTPPADKRWFYLRDRQYFAPPRKRLANG